VKVYRDTQPNQVVRINWDNPIARGLVFACVGGVPVDLVSGATPDTNTSTITSTKLGQMQVTSTATPLVIPRAHRCRPRRTGEFTLWAFGQNQTDTQYPRMVQIRDNDNTSLVFLEQEGSNSYWGFRDTTPGNSFPEYTANKAPTGVGVPYTYGIAMKDGVSFRTYFNGRLHYENLTGLTLFDDSASSLTTNVTWANGTGTFGNYLTLIWDRQIVAGEAASLNANPWQVFESDRKPTVYLPPLVTTTTKQWHATPLVRTTQPTEAASLDLKYPRPVQMYAPGLATVELLERLQPSTEATYTLRADGNAIGLNVTATGRRYTTSLLAGASVWAFLVVAFRDDSADATGDLSVVRKNGQLISLQENSTGEVRAVAWPNAVTQTWSYGTSSTARCKGRINTFSGRVTATTQELWLNGVASSASPAGNWYGNSLDTGNVLCFGATETGTEVASKWTTHLAVFWKDKIPTTAQFADLNANPWQLFALNSRVAWFDHATFYPTLSLAQLINVLATQATPRVTINVP
jgi:hypothetical protein